MLKVIIADDEIWVLRLIKDSIDWESLGMEVICEASDGQDALNKIKQYSPDIVISDVRMPNLDGVNMIKLAKEAGATAKFIMLSGYQDFEYVQRALKYNASDYLLKPYDENILLESLVKVKNEINLHHQHITDMQHIAQQLDSSLDKLRNNLLFDLLYKNIKYIAPIDRLNQDYCFGFQDGIYQVIYCKRTGAFEKNNAYNSVSANIIISNINKHINQFCYAVFTITLPYGIAIILNYPNSNTQVICSALSRMCCTILQELQVHIAASTAIGIGSCESMLLDLYNSMRYAEDSAYCMLYYGCNRVYDIKNYSFDTPCATNAFSAVKQNQFICLIEAFNKEEITKYLNTLFKPFLSESIYPRMLIELCELILDVLYKTLNKIEVLNDVLPLKEDAKSSIERSSSCAAIPQKLISFITDIFARHQANHQETMSSHVRVAKKYISMHYSEPIKLQDVAQMVYLSPQYFSELFKRDVGCNFSDYLSQYRIEISKELLMDTRYRIKDINHMVGYKDSKSFSKLFKQHMGISPLEYRKLHM